MEFQFMLPAVLTLSVCVVAVILTLICLHCRHAPLSKSRKGEKPTVSDEESVANQSENGNDQTLSEQVDKSVDVIETPSNDNRPPSQEYENFAGTVELPEVNISLKQEIEEELLSVVLNPGTDNSSESNPPERESVTSLGSDLAPPMCGTVDFCRQSYGYISPNSSLRPSACNRPDVISEIEDPHRSEMFFDARSTMSGLSTVASWRREIENMSVSWRREIEDMSVFNEDLLAPQETRHSVLSKSYDASSEDSYNTAFESSSNSEADFEARTMCKLPMKKRLMSRKSRSIQRMFLTSKDHTAAGYNFIWSSDAHLSEKKCPTLSLSKGDSTETINRNGEDADEQLLFGEILRDGNAGTKPSTRLNRRGIYGGSFKEKVKEGAISLAKTDFLPNNDPLLAQVDSVSGTDLCPQPRARSHPNIFLRSQYQEFNKRQTTPAKPVRLPSLTVWCPPSSTGVQFTMNVSRKSEMNRIPKPCSAPPDVAYINFKGTLKR